MWGGGGGLVSAASCSDLSTPLGLRAGGWQCTPRHRALRAPARPTLHRRWGALWAAPLTGPAAAQVGSGWLLAPPARDGPPLDLHLLGPTPFDLDYLSAPDAPPGAAGAAGAASEPVLSPAGHAKLAALGGVRLGGGDSQRAADAVAALLADDQVRVFAQTHAYQARAVGGAVGRR